MGTRQAAKITELKEQVEKQKDEFERLRFALLTIGFVDADIVFPHRMWGSMTPKDCYEAGLMDGAMVVRDAVKAEAKAIVEGK